jgi:hypothetical protein
MTTSYAAEVARINSLVEQALAKYGAEGQDRRFADHTVLMLGLLDEWITRAEEIDALRAARDRGHPPDRTEQVAAIEQRLLDLRSLVQG